MGEMKNITLDNGIKKIAVNNLDGELITVLRINTADADTSRRFIELSRNLDEIANAGNDKVKVMNEKYKEYREKKFEELPEDVREEIIVDASEIHICVLNEMISEIDSLFGKDTVKNVFHECYEIHEDFVPDENALIDFVNKVVPVMNDLFAIRTETIRQRYSPNRAARRKNKHKKNRNQRFQEVNNE